ncbi:hypothetical protein TEA_020737 [Camellia sinensis var. sinensis]|uniref:Uncharacterized protein n=1 Tax=Camellia sinensis var. sinensis TaxID=542762 RepID=A0A4S4E8S2_CAMSN|nr:hypothetical protein TEA_020737 [Camellia sinensis var. sinensis]
MATILANLNLSSNFHFFNRSHISRRKLGCVYKLSRDKKVNLTAQMNAIVQRGSESYPPCIWDYDLLQSLDNNYKESPSNKKRVEELKKHVKKLVENEDIKPLAKLELIDNIDRLGLSYHFEKEINIALGTLIRSTNNDDAYIEQEGLHATALRFRILRQHGHKVSQDIFNRFKDNDGNFKPSICEDIKGLLSLYEASFLGIHGEHTMEEAKIFTTFHLKKMKHHSILKSNKVLGREISRALELPRQWQMTRSEARWYIDVDEERDDKVVALLELAKLDYNFVQSVHQKDLADLTRLEFSRDRLVESYLWGLGMASEPQLSNCTKAVAKIIAVVTVVDDIYDVYGSLDELKIFTHAIERWDISASDQLPCHLRMGFIALFNTINELAYHSIKEHGFDSLSYCKQAAEIERGDILKSVQCYMRETGASEEVARDYIWYQIDETWKKITEDVLEDSCLPHSFIRLAINLARVSHFIYQDGDGHGAPDGNDKDQAMSLLVEPIP